MVDPQEPRLTHLLPDPLHFRSAIIPIVVCVSHFDDEEVGSNRPNDAPDLSGVTKIFIDAIEDIIMDDRGNLDRNTK
jgi:hypothetical protein